MDVFITVLLIFSLSLGSVSTQANKCAGLSQADVIFLLDSSTSLGASHFQSELNFTDGVVRALNINPHGDQVGLATFSTQVNPMFQLNAYNTTAAIVNHIDVTPYYEGFTNTAKALEYARQTMLTTSHGRRLSAFPFVIVLTDGKSLDTNETTVQAQMLHDMGALVIALGIGDNVDHDELVAIATDEKYVFNTNFDSLQTLQQETISVLCFGYVTSPPTTAQPTPPATTATAATIVSTLTSPTLSTTTPTTTTSPTTTKPPTAAPTTRLTTTPSTTQLPTTIPPITASPTTSSVSPTTTHSPGSTVPTTPPCPTRAPTPTPTSNTTCALNPCYNGGTCISRDDGSFDCDCAVGWADMFCLKPCIPS